MEKFFNIAGPCNPAKHYMLSATARLPEVASLIRKEQYFVIHAQRQCGKTTAILAMRNEINAGGERVAMYCSLEAAEGVADPEKGIPIVYSLIQNAARQVESLRGCPAISVAPSDVDPAAMAASGVSGLLSELSNFAGKPLVVFFDEVDCLCDATLIAFLRQLRDGAISKTKGVDFPASIALVGMRNIRDYKAKIRPDHESLGSASPFNVLTEAMTLRTFTDDEVAALYAQHTAATGQVFEPEALRLACEYTCGQPYLVNALARWCVEKIHHDDYSKPITAADMHEAKEKIIRERGTHVDSLLERLKEPRVRRVVEPVVLGLEQGAPRNGDDCQYVLDLGILRDNGKGALVPSNPMYAEMILRYLSFDEQEAFKRRYQTPFWLKQDGSLDMPALMEEFQRFWRENSESDKEVYGYKEAMPHLVMMAYLQRVVNGGGHIVREMALGSSRLDLCIEFRASRYAVELKMKRMFRPDKSYAQLAGYLDKLGLPEGWMAVFDEDKTKPWEGKLFARDVEFNGKTLHIIGL